MGIMNERDQTRLEIAKIEARDAFIAWDNAKEEDRAANKMRSFKTKSARYAYERAATTLRVLEKKISKKYVDNPQKYAREVSRRETAVRETENSIMNLNNTVAKIRGGITLADFALIDSINTQLGTEKKKLGVRKYVLAEYKRNNGLRFKPGSESESEQKIENVAEAIAKSYLKPADIPQSLDSSIQADGSLDKISTEFSLTDLLMP
jgi:translation initiation factor 2B subunit (eIF-2B alpha/beta/delta family)